MHLLPDYCCQSQQVITIGLAVKKDGRSVSTSFPSTEERSQNVPRWPLTSCANNVIWTQSLPSRERVVEPRYQGPIHTPIDSIANTFNFFKQPGCSNFDVC